jgi:hypothetical protein
MFQTYLDICEVSCERSGYSWMLCRRGKGQRGRQLACLHHPEAANNVQGRRRVLTEPYDPIQRVEKPRETLTASPEPAWIVAWWW